jgi:hypothetical protein
VIVGQLIEWLGAALAPATRPQPRVFSSVLNEPTLWALRVGMNLACLDVRHNESDLTIEISMMCRCGHWSWVTLTERPIVLSRYPMEEVVIPAIRTALTHDCPGRRP